jgi:hypothetical protein
MSQLEQVTADDHPRFSSNSIQPSHNLTNIKAHDHLRPPYQHTSATWEDGQ